MGLSYEDAVRAGIGHLHPDHGGPLPIGNEGPPPPKASRRATGKNAKGQNKTEAAFDAKLAATQGAGLIRGYGFETMKFRLAQRTWYTPDFPIVLPDFSLIVAEVKGPYIRPDGMLKLKVAAEQLAFPFFLCQYEGRKWTVTRLPSRIARGDEVNVFDAR